MAILTTQVNDSATTVYTSSGSTAITSISFTNYTASAVLVDINVVPSGDSVANVNTMVKDLVIDAKDTYHMYTASEKLLLSNTDFISCTANTASALNSIVSYTSI